MNQRAESKKNYYEKHFPYEAFAEWLCPGDSAPDPTKFPRREFAFTLDGNIFCRYNSFPSAEKLKETLVKELPDRIDLGAVWLLPPGSDSTSNSNVKNEIHEKEFVVDIDLSDYDSLRTCCQGPALCPKCWKFIAVACKSLEIIFRGCFGFRRLQWVYSGRRGAHCWVSDSSARRLNDFKRKLMVNFINQSPKYRMPHRKIYEEVLVHNFEEIVIHDQNLLVKEEYQELLYSYLHKDTKYMFGEVNLEGESSLEVWGKFLKYFDCFYESDQREKLLMELMYSFLKPRIDSLASVNRDHLLKAPFSIHPETGNICVPFSVTEVESFSIDNTPNVDSENLDLEAYVKILTNQT